MSDFITCRKDLDASQFATLFLKEIIQLHGIPQDIITDRGSGFTSELWKHTTEKLRNRTTTKHGFPPTNGWTNQMNERDTRTVSTSIYQLSARQPE